MWVMGAVWRERDGEDMDEICKICVSGCGKRSGGGGGQVMMLARSREVRVN